MHGQRHAALIRHRTTTSGGSRFVHSSSAPSACIDSAGRFVTTCVLESCSLKPHLRPAALRRVEPRATQSVPAMSCAQEGSLSSAMSCSSGSRPAVPFRRLPRSDLLDRHNLPRPDLHAKVATAADRGGNPVAAHRIAPHVSGHSALAPIADFHRQG